jgi:myosin heavy subunit
MEPLILEKCMTQRTMNVMNQSFTISLTSEQASDARDALGKKLYSSLFEWIVDKINSSFISKYKNNISSLLFVGVLDIFGFENFKVMKLFIEK